MSEQNPPKVCRTQPPSSAPIVPARAAEPPRPESPREPRVSDTFEPLARLRLERHATRRVIKTRA